MRSPVYHQPEEIQTVPQQPPAQWPGTWTHDPMYGNNSDSSPPAPTCLKHQEDLQRKLEQVSMWLVSQETEELCRIVGAARVSRMQPAALDLLSWSVEEAAAEFRLDVGHAGMVLEDLQYIASSNPAAAVEILFQLGDFKDNTEEGPGIIHNVPATPENIALAMIAFANQAAI